MSNTRIEKDTMGEMSVPVEALYGASTQRAVLNFQISELRFSRAMIKALGAIKLSSAKANLELSALDAKLFESIALACQEVIDAKLDQHFVVDIFQTGSGTSTNMNANEVIANRATQIGGTKIHPNDHVNMAQSSNDVIPTAIHVSCAMAINEELIPALEYLKKHLDEKAIEFKDILKSGRTHLQDATPITLGQEFSGYATQIGNGIARVKRSMVSLQELALGGTAVGTGLNTDRKFPALAIKKLSELLKIEFVEAPNHFEAQGARDAVVEMSGQLRTIACSLMKIADDLRWLASGPRCGLGELNLPEIQPGSSIMPAKVNPVICESVMMVATQVIGNDTAIALAGQRGNFELNVMLPVIGYNLDQSVNLLASVSRNFVNKCIQGITANPEICLKYAESSLATCTSLAPIIGYDQAAAVAKYAYKNNLTVREAALELKVLPEEELTQALNLMAMTAPN